MELKYAFGELTVNAPPHIFGDHPAKQGDLYVWRFGNENRKPMHTRSFDMSAYPPETLVVVFSQCNNISWLYKPLGSHYSLYYLERRGALTFATDPWRLFESGPSLNDLDYETLTLVSSGASALDPHTTIFKHLRRLPGGHLLVWDGTLTIKEIDRYVPELLPKTIPEIVEVIKSKLLKSATDLVGEKATVGVSLSGGVDSSAAAAAITRAGGNSIHGHWDLRGKFPGAEEFSFANSVSEFLGVPLIDIPTSDLTDYADLPPYSPLPYPHGFLRWHFELGRTLAGRGASVIVSGQHADVLFGPVRELWRDYDSLRYVADLFRYIFHSRAPQRPLTLKSAENSIRKRGAFQFVLPYLTATSRDVIRSFSIDTFWDTDMPPTARIVNHMLRHEQEMELNSALNLSCWWPFHITYKSIYCLRDLVGLALSLTGPLRTGYVGSYAVAKPLLRMACSSWLPADVVTRNYRSWYIQVPDVFLTEKRSYVERLLGDSSMLVEIGVFSPSGLARLIKEDVFKSTFIPTAIMRLVMVEQWLQYLGGMSNEVAQE